ncbi:hypothetical protein ACFSUS_04485 [Spirosoma soli]|uniref:DUF4369 domain-containing protein n=1 Tax=Spirosoma soli TaxID=1770529 RepID=A0ABW5M144_9BACT
MNKWLWITAVWLSFAGSNAVAENPGMWNRGELLLENGIQLTGELNYNWKAEIVQYRQGNTIKAYSAYQVRTFVYFDTLQSTLRKFVSVDYPVKPALSRPLFLEEFVVGPLMVYRRLRHMHEPIKVLTPASFGTDEELVKDIDNFTYLVLAGDDFIDLSDFSRALWPRMQDEFNNELQKYIARLQLEPTSTLARLLLINQYNYLKMNTSPENQSASHTTSAGH